MNSSFDTFQASNFLQSNQFQLIIPSFEATRFLSTTFNIPNINLPSVGADTPFSKMKFAGDKPDYSPLEFEFIIDEQMINFYEIYEWLMCIGYAESFENYVSFKKKNRSQPLGEQDIKVVVLNSKNMPVRTFTFFNAIPVSLSTRQMDSTVSDIEYMRGTVIFDYDYYLID